MLKTAERRRVRVQLPGTLQGSMSLRIDVQVINLSVDGAMIEHSEVLSPGAVFPLFLKLDDIGLCLRAYIVWSHVFCTRKAQNGDGEIRFRSGVHFRDLSTEARGSLGQYLANMSPPEIEVNT